VKRKEVEKLVKQGYSHREIAIELGVSPATVGRFTRKFGIKSKTIGGPRTGPKVFVKRTCAFCGKPIGWRNTKFCSSECQQKFQWERLKLETKRTGKARSHIIAKRYLLETRGRRCESCGRTKWLGRPILLILDHIDGNYTNWKLKNLRMICSNCDAISPHYKGRNRGHGRFSRRQRYRNGLSY
jgi:predicted nucleic acid-binding Zn ribbon protein